MGSEISSLLLKIQIIFKTSIKTLIKNKIYNLQIKNKVKK